MQTIPMRDNRCTDWDAFVDMHPAATFYHLSGWKRVIEKCFGHRTFYLQTLEKGRISGILPIVRLRSLLFGSLFCSMPFLNFGGICAESVEAEAALVEAARGVLEEYNGDYLELRHLTKTRQGLPAKTHKVSMTLSLDSDPERLWKDFKSKHRTTIRRAEKHGLIIKSGGMDLLPDFYRIICIGWHDLGTPIYPYRFFKNIVEEFDNAVEIFVVYYQGQPIASAFNGRFKDTVEGMWTYGLREYIKLQTNSYLYWKMIEKACLDGFKHYHLGRSTNDSGAIDFKKKWNAFPTQLYWEYILGRKNELPELTVENPKYQLARKAWQKLPLAATRIVGPLLSRSIP
jgi:FemAB-related protein (PEP-CTERM system-associated)